MWLKSDLNAVSKHYHPYFIDEKPRYRKVKFSQSHTNWVAEVEFSLHVFLILSYILSALSVLVAQSRLTLWDPMDCSLPGSSVREILQARIMEWVAIPFSKGSSWSKDWTWVSCIAGSFFTIWATREAFQFSSVQFSSVAQSCLTLCERAIRDVIDWLPAVPSESRIWGVTPGEFHSVLCLVAHSCLTLCDLTDYSPPGSSVREILQARIQEWVVMPSSSGSSWTRDWTHVSYVSCTDKRVL